MKLGVANTSADQQTFTMHYWLKEKKQKSKYIIQENLALGENPP